ncbi:MAG TPA: hypothetical protein VNT60_11355 [Deinococcales bacterium]|nr:hypothetical protein [Deinococcales bacterium]
MANLTFRFVGWLDWERDPSLIASAALRGQEAEVVGTRRLKDGLEVTVRLAGGGIGGELAASDALERALATVGCRLESVARAEEPAAVVSEQA